MSSSAKSIRIGTTNPGKVREFRSLLEPVGFAVSGMEGLEHLQIVENGDSFVANAIIKAKAVMDETGHPAVADDSGLVVDCLDGAPGIYSARYAAVENWPGKDQDARNRSKLFAAMETVPDGKRSARFVCALAYCRPGHEPVVFEGAFEGAIGREERGENGFGYDCMFLVAGDTRTSAEMSPVEKNQVSHRAQAVQKFLAYLKGEI